MSVVAGDVRLASPVEREAREFAERIQPHAAILVRLAARVAGAERAEDVVQEALLRAWRHRGRYDSRRGPFVSWLLAIVANEARRAAKGRPVAAMRLGDAADAATASDARLDLEAAVRRLPARQQLAIDCYYFAGLSISETAGVMRCSEGTVKSTLADARARLRREVE